MEVVAGIIAFLGLPAGQLVAYFTPAEKKEISSLRTPLLRLSASASIIATVYALSLPFAHVAALLSLLLLFFEIHPAILLSFSPVLIYVSRGSPLAYVPLSFILLYALLIGITLGPMKISRMPRTLLPYTPYVALALLVYAL